MDDDTDADDSNDDRAPSSPIALASRGIPPRRRRVLPSRRDVRGQISNYQLFSSHMHYQHFPSRLCTHSVVNARKCFTKNRRTRTCRPSTPIPRIDASTVRVIGATTHSQMSNYHTVYPYKNKHTKIKPKSIQTSSNAAARTNGRTDVRRTEHTCSARRRRRRRRRRVSSRLADASRTVGVVGVVGRASKRRCQSVLSGRDDGTRTRATRGRRRRGRRRGGPRRC